ncbi:MAG: putative two-component system response regulator, partial [Colwellia sp.]
SARIVALADFFDALTMDRCYRPAFSDEKALAMVKESSGTHFDPNVVKAFFSVSNDIINERDRINKEN